MNGIGRIVKWLMVCGVLGGGAACTYLWGPQVYARWWGPTPAELRIQESRFATAKREDMKITITEDGKLRAIKNHAIYPQLKGQNKISWLIAEGTSVKKGDKLVEFDKKPREEQLRTRKADLETQTRQLTVAEETLKISRSSAKATERTAETKYQDALVALRVYQNLDGPKKLNELEAAITESRSKHNTRLKEMTDVQKSIDEQMFVEESQRKVLDKQLSDAKLAVEQGQKAVDTVVQQLKTFKRYHYPQELNAKRQAVETSKLDLEKARVSARSEVNQKEQEVAKIKDMIRRLTDEIKELTEEMDRCTLVAPVDGIAVYGDPTYPWRYYGDGQIRVGMDWYGSNVLMTIPDLSAFEVAISIGEEYRGKLGVGAKATISVEAIPGLVMEGRLTKIESLGRNRIQWDPGSPKVFDCTVLPESHDSRMVSGMTTRVEIVAEVVPNALVVPLESVFNDDGTPVCYVRKGQGSERREVEPGKSNDHLVQILKGIAEGDQVDLSPTRAASTGQGPIGAKKPGATTRPTTGPSTQPTTQATTQPTTQATTQEAAR
jgi:multidrug resistance efflux pump